jgi:hypothetical protein
VGRPVSLDVLPGEADIIFKGTAVSSVALNGKWFSPIFGFGDLETRFTVVSRRVATQCLMTRKQFAAGYYISAQNVRCRFQRPNARGRGPMRDRCKTSGDFCLVFRLRCWGCGEHDVDSFSSRLIKAIMLQDGVQRSII